MQTDWKSVQWGSNQSKTSNKRLKRWKILEPRNQQPKKEINMRLKGWVRGTGNENLQKQKRVKGGWENEMSIPRVGQAVTDGLGDTARAEPELPLNVYGDMVCGVENYLKVEWEQKWIRMVSKTHRNERLGLLNFDHFRCCCLVSR